MGELENTAGFALSRERFTLVRCGCGALVYISPTPTDADFKAMYVDHGQFGMEYTDPARVAAIVEYMGGCFDRLAARVGQPGALQVLEVGAGLAWMCRVAKSRDPRHVTVAQDVSPEAVGACPWADDYVQGPIGDARVAARAPYHVVSMTHVIEHVPDPVAIVRSCARMLHPDGLVFITAPHRPAGWREGDLEAWRRYSYNHVPAHLQYFSEASMTRLAEAAGLRLVHWSHAHEGGEAFEAWLGSSGRRPLPWWKRLSAAWR